MTTATTIGPVLLELAHQETTEQGSTYSASSLRAVATSHISPQLSHKHASILIFCITCITAIANLLAGLITVCIPTISKDLSIPPSLQLWPASAFALACGCTLLPCGAIADVVGSRPICLLGAFLQGCSALGSGLAEDASQLIALRTAAGVSAAFCLPSAVAVAAYSFPADRDPKFSSSAFASMGGGQAVGFGLGLVIGGVCADTVGWRWGFFATTILNALVLGLSFWALPTSLNPKTMDRTIFKRLGRDVDWIGALMICTSLALLSYELAVATAEDANQAFKQPLNITLLCLGIVLLPLFALWIRRQISKQKPALIPNRLWTNRPFLAVCITVFLVWGALNASEQLIALYLQDVRGFSTLTSSLYFLPAPIVGGIVNLAVGFAIPYLRPSLCVPIACAISGAASLILSVLCRVNGPTYWEAVFPSVAINPLGADLLYTVANLVVTAAFPLETQALAGSVFHMLSQIGKSVGIATTAVIARQLTAASEGGTKEALVEGYRAGWWYDAALGFVAVGVSLWGLRGVKRLGIKRD